jgi:prepilin-type processing-associated H-X9-DG protein
MGRGKNASDISRRTFLAGSAMATLGAGATAALAADSKASESADKADGYVGTAEGAQPSDDLGAVIDTDVLVIGAGVAGVEAAIAARKAGASVIIVDKKAFGHCGDTGIQTSGRMTSACFEIDGDSVEAHLKNACAAGEYVIDQEFVRQVIQAYYDEAVTLKDENYGSIHFRAEDGTPFIENSTDLPRCWAGYRVTNSAFIASQLGVRVMEYVNVTKLLAGDDGQVVGACAVDFRTGSFYAIRAKGTILATGGDTGLWGAGSIAARHGGGAEYLMGDGHALAAPFGVTFRDLEFRSLYPRHGALFPTGLANFGTLGSEQWDEYKDADGNYILRDDPQTLRSITVAWYKAQIEGRGTEHGGVYAPLDDFGAGAAGAGYLKLGIGQDSNDQCGRAWEHSGFDLHDGDKVEVGPQHIYDYGGIVTDIDGATGVDGLYAAGECAMHCGAGYSSLRMFSSGMVMGNHAGKAAAGRAAGIDAPLPVDWEQVRSEKERVFGMLENEPDDPMRVHELKHRIQDTAWKGAGALRSDARCAEALAEFDEEESDLKRMRLEDKSKVCNVEWMEALSLANAIKMGRMDTLAARTRTESRGTHLRAEYPEQDNVNWLKNVYITETNGELKVEVRDTNITDYRPEKDKVDLGGGVLENF